MESVTVTREHFHGLLAVEDAARVVVGILEEIQACTPGLLTCGEAESVAHLLDLLEDGPERAERFLEDHSRGDDDPEDAHYEMGKAVHAADVARINKARGWSA
jgi:hypothetical protein